MADRRVHDLSGNWRFRQVGDTEWIDAFVPGCVHTDLLSAGIIPDPYFACNEDSLQWTEDIDLSGQFVQQTIIDYHYLIDQDEFDNTATLLARRDFLRETLALELFTYIGLNNQGSLIRPRIYYDLTDGLEILLGANIFTGDEGCYGQYSDNNMGYFKVKYSF
jgi:hypothetical protein